jgi:GMP synthase (glutamine-hydrolysing)
MKNNELVLVIDFGGQYNQLIARRVRENNVYCEILPYDTPIEKIRQKNPGGIIFTGGPSSVFDEGAPRIDKEVFELGIPILGICYGCQLIGYLFEGKVEKGDSREYGKTGIKYEIKSKLFKGLDEDSICWMSHTLRVSNVPEGYKITAATASCPVAAMENEEKGV